MSLLLTRKIPSELIYKTLPRFCDILYSVKNLTRPLSLRSTFTMTNPSSKKQRTQPPFDLYYWPGIPGRGEYIRLPLEASGSSYTEIVRENENGFDDMIKLMDSKGTGDENGNPPCLAPPMLGVSGAGKDGKYLVMHQTPAILQYLGPKIGMTPEDEADQVHVMQITLTALDLSNETHDTHHPIGLMDHYEDQKPESLKKASYYRENRIPKFFNYFERVLKGNEKKGQGKYLVGDKLTFADTTLWQVIDGSVPCVD